jgi:hypothetical protein
LETLAEFEESFKDKYINLNINQNEYTDDFRRIQKESRRVDKEDVSRIQREEDNFDNFKRMVGAVYERLLTKSSNAGKDSWAHLSYINQKKGINSHFKISRVNGSLFHDIFEINRNYLPNGELVDLHDNYDNCKCYLSDDGLYGFAIEPDGNLISVFSLNPSDKLICNKRFYYRRRSYAS